MPRSHAVDENIIDHISTAVFITDTHLSIAYANEAAESMLNLSLKQAKGRTFQQCFIELSNLLFIAEEAQHWQRTFSEYGLRLINTNKQSFFVDCFIKPIGKQRLLFEMTEAQHRHHIEQQEHIKHIQEASSLLIKGLAHEIRNPLAGLKGATQLLQKRNIQGIDAYLDIFIHEIDRLDRLLNDSLSAHASPQQTSTVNIHKILNHVSQLMQASVDVSAPSPSKQQSKQPPVTSRANIEFHYDYDPSIPDIHADEQQLTQAFINIVRNAIQAIEASCEAAGKITLSTRVHSGSSPMHQGKNMLHVCIQDNGLGIATALQDKIFIPMVTTKAQGTGVGLSITHDIIRRHHGSISFESLPKNTSFNVYLPLK